MKKLLNAIIGLLLLSSALPGQAVAGGADDPLLSMLLVDQLELRSTDGATPLVWDAEGWLGKDLHKLWFKTEGEYVDGSMEEFELQALYSRAIAPFWDLQIGWRRNFRPTPTRDWLAVGFKGLAPYFFDIDTALFIGSNGRTALRLEAEYEFMLTQRLILSPDIEINFYGKDDAALGIGSGLSDSEAGLRLRYEIRREFAPYIGVNWNRSYGKTADLARAEGSAVNDTQLVFGIRTWF
ncbi:MAG: copper resistance protein B [Geopsychrobacter sp.]|nr:copper resistance protein B [Geopsychrobacter sp.]